MEKFVCRDTAKECFFQNPASISMAVIFFFLFFGCAGIRPPTPAEPQKPVSPLIRMRPEAFPRFSDSYNYDNLEHCIKNSLTYLKRRPPNKLVYFGEDPYPISHLIRSLTDFLNFIQQKPSPDELNKFIAANYLVYRARGGLEDGRVLFTGYFEPFLEGSPVKTAVYRYPIYSLPRDLISVDLSQFSKNLAGKRINGRFNGKTLVPYYSRKEIETNPDFAGKAKPIAWVKDRVDLFFLHIQGSGQVVLTSGQTIHVHYHGVNGRPYSSIGRLLIDQGKISREEMSMQKIKEYLKAHPQELDAILQHNSSYVFFKREEEGPLGYLGVPLTPARSAAFDRTVFPPAALAFISTQIPTIDGSGQIKGWTDHKGFVLNQDTGGAIKGPGRADLFWGSGPYAEIAAGHMQNQGDLYFLILNPPSL